MPLQPGTTLGPYQVTAKIGEGGMGEVYRARDTKLDRDVALKVLPEAFTQDPDRLARFEREAKVLASLNHPNIAAIYGLEEADGIRALVLELVEGPTLADRIKRGPIPLDEALPIAKQIAEALEAAHEAGVIHRDLKPANIKVRDDGTVKVLDFGLAKALDPTPEGDPSQSPTLTAAATQMGVIMGTAAYMSPEQARGKPVDKRADIWAFGCVLYEMLAGQMAFQGEDVSLTLASVMKSDLNVTRLPHDVPATVRTVLRRCLEKDPSQRIRDIGDVRLAMEGAFETTGRSHGELIPAQAAGWKQTLPWVAGIVLAVVTGLAVWTVMRPAPPRLVRFTVSPDEAVPLYIAQISPDVAISPTGEHVAYLTGSTGIGGLELHVRSLDQHTSETLVTGSLNSPFFSPDGSSVGFYDNSPRHARSVLQRVSIRGGPLSTICEFEGSLKGASWGTDGTIVFGTTDPASGLWRVAAVGGEPTQLTTPNLEQGEVDHVWPEMLPDSSAVLFTIEANRRLPCCRSTAVPCSSPSRQTPSRSRRLPCCRSIPVSRRCSFAGGGPRVSGSESLRREDPRREGRRRGAGSSRHTSSTACRGTCGRWASIRTDWRHAVTRSQCSKAC